MQTTSRLKWPARWIGMAALLFLIAACDRRPAAPPVSFKTVDITGVDWGKDFHLTDHRGRPVALADFRGKAVMLFMGYTHCPDMCPTTLAKMAAAVRKLGKDGDRVQGLFMTLDPKRDTADVLAQYVPAFHPSFLGLHADEQQTADLAGKFKLFFKAQKADSSGNYTIDHNSVVYVFDPQGRLRLYMKGDTPVADMVHDLKQLIAK